jgi:hypothetical protein
MFDPGDDLGELVVVERPDELGTEAASTTTASS